MEATTSSAGNARTGSWMAIDVKLTNSRAADRRRDQARGRRPGTDALRRRRRPADPIRQDVSTVCAAALVRAGDQGRPGVGRHDARQHQGRVHAGRRQPAGRRHRRRTGGRHHRQHRPAARRRTASLRSRSPSIPPACPPESRRGARSIDWSGRTPTRPACRPSSWPRCAGGSPAAAASSSSAAPPDHRACPRFPDLMLPYRPTATTDVAPASLGALLGEVPDSAGDMAALSGELSGGRALVERRRSRRRRGSAIRRGHRHDRRVRPDASNGSPRPTPPHGLWGQLLPPRTQGGTGPRRRQPDRVGGVTAALAGAAADRWAASPCWVPTSC